MSKRKKPNHPGKDKVTPETRSKIMASIRSKGNKSTERRLRAYLVQSGISGWKLNPKGIVGKPDFVFPNAHLAVFIDGCFWHGCPQCFRPPQSRKDYWDTKIDYNRARDARKTRTLQEAGWQVIRFWEHELRDNPSGIIAQIKAAIASGSPSQSGL